MDSHELQNDNHVAHSYRGAIHANNCYRLVTDGSFNSIYDRLLGGTNPRRAECPSDHSQAS
eukprot:2804099-Prymnesium_polylepis.1